MADDITIPQDKETQAVVQAAEGILKHSEALTIVDDDGSSRAVALLEDIKTNQSRIEKHRLFIVGPLNKMVKSYNDFFARYSRPLKAAEEAIKRKISSWRESERRRVEEEKGKHEEAVRKVQEEAEAARKKQEDEAWEKAQEQSVLKNEAENRGEATPNPIQDPVAPPPTVPIAPILPPPPKEVPKALSGSTGTRMDWTFEIENVGRFLGAIGSEIPPEVITINRGPVLDFIRHFANQCILQRATEKEAISMLYVRFGIKAWKQETIVAGRRMG